MSSLNKKFILQEKLILTEDLDPNIQQSINKFNAALATLTQKVTNVNKINALRSQLNNLESQRQKYVNTINSLGGIDAIKTNIRNYLAEFAKVIDTKKENTPIYRAVQDLETKLNITAGANQQANEQAEAQLKNAFLAFSNIAQNVIASSLPDNESLSNVGQLNQFLEIPKLESIDDTDIKNVGLTAKVFNETLDKATTAAEQPLEILTSNSESLAALEEAKKAAENVIKAKLAREKEKANTRQRYKVNQTLSRTESTDWANLILTSPAEQKLELWDKYFTEVWKENSNKVKELGEPFKTELLKLGFDELANPFITFVRYCLRNSINIERIGYGLIHNAFIDHWITANDLRGKGLAAENGQSYNIIFCNDFYTKTPATIYTLLQAQYEVFKHKNTNFVGDRYPTAINLFGDKLEDTAIVSFIKALLYEGGSTIKGIIPSISNTKNAILKPLRDINNELIVNFGEDNVGEEVKAPVTDRELTNIISKLNQLPGGLSKDNGIKLIKFLIMKYMSTAKAEATRKKYKLDDNLTKINDLTPFLDILSQYNINKDNVDRVINEVGKLIKITDNN